MRRIAFDTETHLIKSGQLFPRLVCVTFAEQLIPGGMTVNRWIRHREDGLREIFELLNDPEVTLVGHNVAYDLGVCVAEAQAILQSGRQLFQGFAKYLKPLTVAEQIEPMRRVWQAYEDGRIADTMIRAQLWDIARGTFQEKRKLKGRYTLQRLAQVWANKTIEKEDTWRLHYAALSDTPVEQWPADARDYALDDAEVTLLVDEALRAKAQAEGASDGKIPDEDRQARAAWVLHLIAGWGVRVDPDQVAAIKANLEAMVAIGHAEMAKWGVLKPNGKKSMKRLQELIEQGFAAQGKKAPRTAGTAKRAGQTKTSAAVARESGHPAAMAFADIANAAKILSTYIPPLERGCAGIPITSRPNVLVASGRCSWGDPNWQNPPRVGGVRDCVVARPGHVLCAADLDTVELRALAQTCLELLGWSEMAAALQRGEDLHLSLGAEILGIDYATAKALYDANDAQTLDARQDSKPPNFGFPGGMGAKKFAKNYNDHKDDDAPEMTLERATFLREAWFRRWREMRDYLAYAGQVTDAVYGTCTIEQPWSGRIRGGLDYCAAANTFFQGRVADGAKLALWRLARACYVDTTSPLFGSRLILFLHDEVILEVPEFKAAACAAEITRILCAAVQEVIPDIPITSAAVLMRRWYKGAKPVYVNGMLVPGKPEKVIGPDGKAKTKWVFDSMTCEPRSAMDATGSACAA
jgi:DNA polymerase-1